MPTVFLTTGTTWTVPSDWNSASNTIECIGGGGGATSANSSNVGTGGEGGHYAKSQNITLTPLATVNIAIGTGGTGGSSPTAGGSTWFNGTTLATSSCGALGGAAGTNSASNATTATTNDVGNVVKRQGGFGCGIGGDHSGGSGGGGAAGQEELAAGVAVTCPVVLEVVEVVPENWRCRRGWGNSHIRQWWFRRNGLETNFRRCGRGWRGCWFSRLPWFRWWWWWSYLYWRRRRLRRR